MDIGACVRGNIIEKIKIPFNFVFKILFSEIRILFSKHSCRKLRGKPPITSESSRVWLGWFFLVLFLHRGDMRGVLAEAWE